MSVEKFIVDWWLVIMSDENLVINKLIIEKIVILVKIVFFIGKLSWIFFFIFLKLRGVILENWYFFSFLFFIKMKIEMVRRY